MASPQAVIAEAFEKLRRSVSEEDAHKFASTELNDVWSAIREIDSIQRKRLSAQNLRRIEPLLRGIEKYTKVIEVLCNGTPYMPYIWIASHHRDVFEALLSAYADIGAALPRFDRYKKAFDDNLEFQHSLATVYSAILDFHQRAYKFFRRRAWQVIFLSLWKDFGSRFDTIIDSLKKQRDFVDLEAASFDIVEAKESRTRIQDEIRQRQKRDLEMLEEKERNTRISHLQYSIAWLHMDTKIQETEYERTSKRRHDRTCEWMVNEPQFKSWIKNDAKRPCLWLDGKPGSGKSVMCSHIVQVLTNTPGLTVCYYFCNSQDTGNVCRQILAIIVLQILSQHPDICTLIANGFVYRGASCGMAQLKILVPQLLEIVSYTRIVVDGIDECSKENQKAILKELDAICTGSTTRCKILLSSRREVHIHKKLSQQPQISLDGRPEVDWDIRSFVKYKIAKLRTSDQDLLNRIESVLVEKANGMFLWVRLVVDELKYCYSDAALEETTTSLPKGLKAAYGRIIDRIMDSSNSRNARDMAIRILGWMACSHRILKSYEILDGVAFDASNTTLTPKTKIRKEVLDLCRPLIEEGPASTVNFVHFSAKEYILEEEYQAGRPFIWREKAHLDISFSCIAFLNSCISLLPKNSTEAQRAAIIVQGCSGLQIYADRFWHEHLLLYCDLLRQHRSQFSIGLLSHLQLLLRFRKENSRAPVRIFKVTTEKSMIEDTRLEALNDWPDIKRLVSDVIEFRAKISREDATDKSIERISLDSCEEDPTYFSIARHHYQQTTESLLDERAMATFPEISKKDLQVFRDTYGSCAFVCRYLHCVFSSDGFDSFSNRTKHESQHQRKFPCAHPSCVYFTSGFITRNLLNKHNEKYHAAITEGPSLAESLAPLLTEPMTRPRSDGQGGQNRQPFQGTSPQDGPRSVNSPNSNEQIKHSISYINNTDILLQVPEGQNRGSPGATNFIDQGGQMDGGINPQFYKINSMVNNMMPNGIQPPSSYPGFNPQGMTRQQEQQRQALPAQVQQLVSQRIQENTGPVTGWQSSVIFQERISTVFSFIGKLRMIAQAQTSPQPLHKHIEMAVAFEKDLFEKSTDKAHYKREIARKLAELLEHRNRLSYFL
ncbi:hypothetical protein ACMFMF_011556 [Clarireedia jacksonii]